MPLVFGYNYLIHCQICYFNSLGVGGGGGLFLPNFINSIILRRTLKCLNLLRDDWEKIGGNCLGLIFNVPLILTQKNIKSMPGVFMQDCNLQFFGYASSQIFSYQNCCLRRLKIKIRKIAAPKFNKLSIRIVFKTRERKHLEKISNLWDTLPCMSLSEICAPWFGVAWWSPKNR